MLSALATKAVKEGRVELFQGKAALHARRALAERSDREQGMR